MNKKHLSVVMAGAMLASSVAPVLAEVVKEEVSANELGLLVKKVREKLNSAKFADETAADIRRNTTDKGVKKAGKSIYFIAVDGKNTGLLADSTQDKFVQTLGSLKPGQKVEIWSYAHVEENGKYYINKESKKTFDEKSLEDAAKVVLNITASTQTVKSNYANIIDSASYDADTDMLSIDFKEDVNNNKVSDLSLTIGSDEIDVEKYIDVNGEVKTISSAIAAKDFFGFPTVSKFDATGLKNEKLEEITITPGGKNLSIEQLYDGLMLTTEGHDFFAMLKEAKAMGRNYTIKGSNGATTINNATDAKNNIVIKNGKTMFSVELEEVKKGSEVFIPAETYTITSSDVDNARRLATWMVKPLARVDILAGDNRYETAVEIAKEYAGLTGPEATNNSKTVKNVVLVNGEALVDGLAASPLAAEKTNQVYNNGWKNVSAPILLTESDKLPNATKKYLKELMADQLVGAKKEVKIHLVGGEAVLSKSLERELRGLGFDVERYGGSNREETSLEVMKAMNSKNEAFVVGANGEADAMSIAAVAAKTKTPIVVAKNGGISEDAIYELNDSKVTVIGGEKAVSKEEEKAIKAEVKGFARVAGANRQATNALVIEKYYAGKFGDAQNVIVAKDGQHNKMELVDALTAANMASEKKAPVVLATNKLSNAQISALELNAKKANSLYQVGIGVSKDVVKEIAQRLGLTNLK